MKVRARLLADRGFTGLAWLAVALIVSALVAILLPMAWRGGGAVVFRGTVDFRRMQLEHFHRGELATLQAERAQTDPLRARAYAIYDQAAEGIDVSRLEEAAGRIVRQLGDQLDNQDLPREQSRQIRAAARKVRDKLLEALASTDRAEVFSLLAEANNQPDAALLRGTVAERLPILARQYRTVAERIDLTKRDEFARSMRTVQEALKSLLGPRAGEPPPAMAKDQYGATRWDQVLLRLDRLLYDEQWQPAGPGQPLRKVRVPREEFFAGTPLAELFPFVRDNLEGMFRPQGTFYWRYFLDDGLDGHYFGGVGPEILGTVILTVLAMVFALPVGVTTAAYLVECSKDNLPTKVLRTCVNTLAGVPSIVFGLFGLAFFVLYLQPKLGLGRKECILAGSLTLAVLVLPVIIRASEEAIRAVPHSFKEAALSVGASRFRCFVTVTLPAALPGILTGVILSLSRAAGETAPILFTAGAVVASVPHSILEPTRTLSYSSWNLAVGSADAAEVPHNQFGMVMTLVAVVLILNVAAIVLRGRISRKLSGH